MFHVKHLSILCKAGIIVICGSVLLGCVSVSTFTPYAPVVYNPKQYALDGQRCLQYARNYSPGVDLQGIASAGVTGAVQNVAEAAISPAAVGLSAAGAAGAQALSGLGLNSQAQIHVYVLCLDHFTDRDHSALVLDPN